MKKLHPYPIALASFFIFTVFYVICISIKLILTSVGVGDIWRMNVIWRSLIPGFTGLDSLSIILGLFIVSIGSYSIAYLVIPLYNFLIKDKISSKSSTLKPLKLRFKVLFVSILVFLTSLYILCLLYDLFVPKDYQMYVIWQTLLPGFNNLTIKSSLIGLLDLVIYSLYTSFIISKILNYFERTQVTTV